MEQLQPVLKHKFWILFGLALLLPVGGWFVATGKATSEIEERIAKIQGTNVQSGTNAPNDQWIQSLDQVNDRERELLNTAAAYLWEQQKGLMVWPREIRDMVGRLNYRDPIPDQALNFYVRLYQAEHERAQRIVRPYDAADDEGIVAIRGELPIHPNYSQWHQRGTLSSSEEMWDAQEDIWLLRALLQAVARTNQQADAKSIAEAPVRQIDRIQLMGGSRSTGTATGPAGGPGSGFDSEMPDGMEYEMPEEYNGGMPGGGGQRASVSFNPTEEFGSAGGTMGGMMGAGLGPSLGSAEIDADGNGPMAMVKPRRYVDDEDLPFRTRGFYMELVMDHTKLPELLGELISSPWPVEVVRVQQGEVGSGGGGGGGYGGGGGGYGMTGGSPFGRGLGGGGSNPFLRGGAAGGRTTPFQPRPGGGAFRQPTGSGPFRPPGRATAGPMGTGPMGPMGPMGRATGPQRRSGEKYQTAMQDPILARVAIAGLMTLFEKPTEQTNGVTAASGQPAAETAPAANGTELPDASLPAEPPVYPDDGDDAEPPLALDGVPAEDAPADLDPAVPAREAAEPLPEDEAAPADQPLPPLDDDAPAGTPPPAADDPGELGEPAATEPVPNG